MSTPAVPVGTPSDACRGPAKPPNGARDRVGPTGLPISGLPGLTRRQADPVSGDIAGSPHRPSPWAWKALLFSDIFCPLLVVAVTAVSERHLWQSGGDNLRATARLCAFVGVTWASFGLASWLVRLHVVTRRHLVTSAADGLGRAEIALVLGSVLALALDGLTPTTARLVVPPHEVVVVLLVCMAALPAARTVTLAACSQLGARPARVLVVGTGTIAADVASRLGRTRLVEFAGYVDDDPVEGQATKGRLGDLHSVCASELVDRVVVAFSSAHPVVVAQALRQVPEPVPVDVIPRYFDMAGWQTRVDDLDGLAVVSLGRTPNAAGRVVKRLFDLLGAVVALILLLPVLVLAAACVRRSSPGPVLFRQTRLGRHRVPFQVLKFRTMVAAEPQPAQVEPDSPGGVAPVPGPAGGTGARPQPTPVGRVLRPTPVGRVLRRTGVDELPQLVNVLLGQMSLVGPRPFVAEECADLPAWAERRFDVRPGMTGLWQVCGQHALRVDELHRLDTQYATGWSLSLDARILARTPGRLLQGGGDRDSFRSRHQRTLGHRGRA